MRRRFISLVRLLLRVPEQVDVRAHVRNTYFQRVLRINAGASWPVHFTSQIAFPERVRRGRASYPGDMPGCYIQALNGIEIGDGCQFGPGVGLISANHDPLNLDRHLPAPPIRIGHRCWIGMHAVILPGVQLGDRTVVGAGAVVTRSFPQGDCVLAGNPARVIRQL